MVGQKGCSNHKPVQHRDGKPPWCKECGLTANNTIPKSRFDKKTQSTSDYDEYVVKVRRPGGGYSIIDITNQSRALRLVDEFNERYQSNNYYYEPYKKQDEYGYAPGS